MEALPSNIGWKKQLILLKKYALRKNNLIFYPHPKGYVKGFDTQNDESTKRQLTDNIPLRDVIRTFMATRPTEDGFLTK